MAMVIMMPQGQKKQVFFIVRTSPELELEYTDFAKDYIVLPKLGLQTNSNKGDNGTQTSGQLIPS